MTVDCRNHLSHLRNVRAGEANVGMVGRGKTNLLCRLSRGKWGLQGLQGQGLANIADVRLSYQCGTEVMSGGMRECALVGYHLYLRHCEFDIYRQLVGNEIVAIEAN